MFPSNYASARSELEQLSLKVHALVRPGQPPESVEVIQTKLEEERTELAEVLASYRNPRDMRIDAADEAGDTWYKAIRIAMTDKPLDEEAATYDELVFVALVAQLQAYGVSGQDIILAALTKMRMRVTANSAQGKDKVRERAVLESALYLD
jgi:hypothetical protein